MDFLNKLERKYGRYAIPNLMVYIIILNAAGFILYSTNPQLLQYIWWDMSKICRGQIWRLVTFIMMPFDSSILSFLLFAVVYYSIASSLERAWGTFRLNVYIFTGLFGHILAGIIAYFVFHMNMYTMNTYYLNTSLFLALAMTYPETRFLLFFVIPIKAKWLAAFSGVVLIYEMIVGTMASRVMIFMSLINFMLFLYLYGKQKHYDPRSMIRRQQFKRKAEEVHRAEKAGLPRHKCSVCGRTDKDFPDLEFRYCSKCEGAYEYCMEHLYTHIHVTEDHKYQP